MMGADAVSLQGLAESFAALDPEGTGKIPYEAVRELLASGKYDLSEVEVRQETGEGGDGTRLVTAALLIHCMKQLTPCVVGSSCLLVYADY